MVPAGGGDLERADLDFGAANVVTQLADEPPVTFDQITGAFSVAVAFGSSPDTASAAGPS